ncbi:unnamed protein product [Microthlaspi erraticum]|uniref:Integrase zinc-binding domain-containing protein n=1 Tax=Microthlaspi erraticum TaxID=1685480 RepID=A0A6D2J6J9_9BRAS|nr:unnamed protein product [Microthlaspi erraticum]
MKHLETVFSILRQQQLYLKASKCTFGATVIEYLGHFISAEGVSTDPAKIKAVTDWPTPTNQKQLRSFLGLTNYYRRFIKALTSAPVLALPDFEKTFVIETDASNTGIGAVLMQDNHPICYISRALGPRHQSLSVYEKELMAVKISTPFQHMWLSKLMGFTFEIQYKQGKENYAADALFRVTGSQLLQTTLSQAHQGFYDSIQLLWKTDPQLLKIISDLSANPSSHHAYTYTNDELRRKEKLVIGNDQTVKLQILEWLHDSAVGGHSGRDATLHRVKSLFFWPKMNTEVQNYVRNCDVCQRNKYDLAAKPGLLQPLPVPEGVWQSISMDFIEGLPPSSGKHCIWWLLIY